MDLKIENKSLATVRFYSQFTKGFAEAMGDTPVSHITPEMVVAYFAEVKDEHQFAQASRFRAIRRMFNWAIEKHYLDHNPVTFKGPEVPEVIKPTFSQADLELLVKACSGKFVLRDAAIVLTFRDTGARLGEMARIKMDHIDLEGRILKLLGKGKGQAHKERLIGVRPETAKAIWKYMQWRWEYCTRPTPFVWISDDRKPLTTDGIENVITRLGEKAGVRYCHPHTFRHTFAQTFLESGGNPLDLQYLLGHRTLEMVRRYSRAQEEQRALLAQRKMFES
jgi:integrase/recombinase XerD